MTGTGDRGQQLALRMHFHFVITQQPRPFARNIVKQGVRFDHFGIATFRGFNTIVPCQATDRQNFLHSGMAIARAAVNSLEAEITTNHHQRAAAGNVVMDQRQPVGGAPAFQPGIRMQQQRIGADIRENNRIPLPQRFLSQREVGRRRVGGHIGDRVMTVRKRGQKIRCAGMPGGGGKLIEAFNVC